MWPNRKHVPPHAGIWEWLGLAGMGAFYILLKTARQHLQNAPIPPPHATTIFREGARWMAARMQELSPESGIVFDPNVRFGGYGWLKYGLSLIGMGVALYFLVRIHWLLAPFCVVIFYLIEVHFLFLFPLLIEKHPQPILESIRMTRKMGVISTALKVMRIGCFMVIGLLRPRPLANWYTGCMAVLIWYYQEKAQKP